jgi:hypothetical protein
MFLDDAWHPFSRPLPPLHDKFTALGGKSFGMLSENVGAPNVSVLFDIV